MAYLTSQTIFGDIREKFLRLQQISTLLNLDSVRLIELTVFIDDSLAHHRMKTLTSFTMGPVYPGKLVPMKPEQSQA